MTTPVAGGPVPAPGFDRRLQLATQEINDRLQGLCREIDGRLGDAMRHAIMTPGKRIRPLLAMATLWHFGKDGRMALDVGCAIEYLHTASLILDDLPCMDDDNLRRGHPATHVAFDEETAILAAMAFNNGAYQLIADTDLDDAQKVGIVRLLAASTGSSGLPAGQMQDLKRRNSLDRRDLETINDLKTAMLFKAAMTAGAIVAGVAEPEQDKIRDCAHNLGLAFQLLDDFDDHGGDLEIFKGELAGYVGRATACLGTDFEHSELTALANIIFSTDRLAA